MTPGLPRRNLTHCVPGDPVIRSYLPMKLARGYSRSDRCDLCCGELLNAPGALTPFPHCVQMVVESCPEEEMSGVNAPRVVAPVTDFKIGRNDSARGPIGETVGPHAPLQAADVEDAVSAIGDMTLPLPAGFRISSMDFCPELRENVRPPCGILPQLGVLPSETGSCTECYVNYVGHGLTIDQSERFRLGFRPLFPVYCHAELATRTSPVYHRCPQFGQQLAIRVDVYRSESAINASHPIPITQLVRIVYSRVCLGRL